MVTENEVDVEQSVAADTVRWLDTVLPQVMRRLADPSSLESPLMQLPVAQLRVVRALSEVGPDSPEWPGETMGRLSERLRVRHNALTQAADRLVAHGLVRRNSDPRDRRVVRLQLTQKGREWVAAHRAARRAHLRRLVGTLSAHEVEMLVKAARMLDAATSRLAAPAGAEAGRTSGNGIH